MATQGPTREETSAVFGDVVRTYRRAAGLTQEAVAERAGLSTKHVARVERGERTPTVHAVLLLASGLGVPAVDLVGELADRLGLAP